MNKFPLLLAEPNSLLRQTVALTAGSIRIGPIFQASTLRMARKMVLDQPFAAIIVPRCWDDDPDIATMLEFIAQLRAGDSSSSPNVPVFVTARACSLEEAESLADLNVRRVLIKPFKARVLIEALAELSFTATEPGTRIRTHSDLLLQVG
jgi:CheY-like chemotaxis protein